MMKLFSALILSFVFSIYAFAATTLIGDQVKSSDRTKTWTMPASTGTLARTADNVATATALASNPTDCGAGTKATAIDAQGNLTCSAVDLTADTTGVNPVANGGTNSSTALNNNRVMKSAGGAIVEAAAITANRAVVSDANGIPVHSTTTDTEIGYVNGVTSAIQTQFNLPKVPQTSDSSTGNIDALDTSASSSIRLTGAAPALRGIANGAAGRILYLANASGVSITVSNEHATPTAADRIITGTGADLTMANTASLLLKYDATSSRWRVIGGSGGGSGGDFSSNTATSVDGEIVLFSGTGGKTGKRATGTGYAKITSGVLSAQSTPIPSADVNGGRTINAQTGTTYTFALSDGSGAGGFPLVTASNASAQTYTVPPNSSVAFPVGTQIDLVQQGAGAVTIAPGDRKSVV